MSKNIDLKEIMTKWDGLLNEGGEEIKNVKVRRATALMLENQMAHLQEQGYINEAGPGNTQGSFGRDGGYQVSGDFHKIAIPMVRRTFPELIAHDLVGVQPLTGPVGIAFALRFQAAQTYNAPSLGGNHTPGNELGYNNIDPTYSGSMATSAGEGLGSKVDPNMATAPTMGHGIGIGDGTTAKEIGFSVEKEQVEAKTRKLRSRWSLEVAQDLKAMHGLDLEEEMMDILAYEITAEIDREIVGAIRTAANNNESSNVAGKLGALDWNDTGAFDGRWEHEKYRNLFNLLVRKANRIAIDTRRGAGNFCVANPTVCAAFEGSSAFTIAPVDTDVSTAVSGVTFLGTIDGRIKLYHDTFTATDEFVVGYKGPSAYDSGIIYLPYIQLMVNRATFEDSFNPALGLMSRYAIMEHLFGASNYYIRGVIENMP